MFLSPFEPDLQTGSAARRLGRHQVSGSNLESSCERFDQRKPNLPATVLDQRQV
jgi:hypothetical protein